MLCGMALHLLISIIKIYYTLYEISNGERGIDKVIYDSVLLRNATYSGCAEVTRIGILSALLGKKRGPVQNDLEAALPLAAGKHGGAKMGKIGVFVV